MKECRLKPVPTLGLAFSLLSSPLGAVAMENLEAPNSQTNRLVIVDGAADQVICDDGRATFSA
jgi:hypothetical protein